MSSFTYSGMSHLHIPVAEADDMIRVDSCSVATTSYPHFEAKTAIYFSSDHLSLPITMIQL